MELLEQVFGKCIFLLPIKLGLIIFHFIGRTTFINTLCGQKVLQHKEADDPMNAHIEEGVKIKPVTVGKLHQFVSKDQSCFTGE